MATGTDIVTDAMAEIGIFEAETAIEPADMQLGIRKLNDMLSEWDSSGIKLGFTPLGSEADEVRIPRGAVSAVKYNLAGRLSVPFSKPITPELAAEIRAANQALLAMTMTFGSMKLPATLPKGGGNDQYFDSEKFFSEQDKANF